MSRSCPILLYHHVSPDRLITPQALESQLSALLSEGYESVSLDEFLEIKNGSSVRRPFVVTFDDGYIDNWFFAFPILERLQVKATMYVITERAETAATPRPIPARLDTLTREREPGGFFSWSEARAMSASGLITIGSHTHTHRGFARRRPYDDLEMEVAKSKELIEENVGVACRHLAWPWGDYRRSWLPLVKRLGYRTAVTTRFGANTSGTDPLDLHRINVSKADPAWLINRCRWHASAWAADGYGLFYGLDKRLKSWVSRETPYPYA